MWTIISGTVQRCEARVRLKIKGLRTQVEIESSVDTGFTGDLTLPSVVISRLRLPWHGFDRNILADGSIRTVDVFEAEVEWNGRFRPILIDEGGPVPLLGMRLLEGHELRIHVRDGGKVAIKRVRR